MYLLYLDEFGHPGPYEVGNFRHCQHPLFGFAGIAVAALHWRDLDRGFLNLKRVYYGDKIRHAGIVRGIRAEQWEPKQLSARRDKRFATDLLHMIRRCKGNIFAYGCLKHSTPAAHNEEGLYTSHVQGLMRSFEKFLRDAAGTELGRGAVVMDRRTEKQNQRVLASAQSYLFSSLAFRRRDTRVIETPLLVPSEWYHGVQTADMIGRIVAALHLYRICKDNRYQWAESLFGALVGKLTYRIDQWSSVFIHR